MIQIMTQSVSKFYQRKNRPFWTVSAILDEEVELSLHCSAKRYIRYIHIQPRTSSCHIVLVNCFLIGEILQICSLAQIP